VRLRAERRGAELHLEVADNGRGLAAGEGHAQGSRTCVRDSLSCTRRAPWMLPRRAARVRREGVPTLLEGATA